MGKQTLTSRVKGWSRHSDSNRGPAVYETAASMRRPNHLAGFAGANGPLALEEISLDQRDDVRREGL
ncbi:MAG TPA: hypothetical protein VIM30_13795, partial [Candidatus Limnocylindrales bacterium]